MTAWRKEQRENRETRQEPDAGRNPKQAPQITFRSRSRLPLHYMRKEGAVAVNLARRLMAMEPGERLPRLTDLAREFQVGQGTVHQALKSLVEAGAAEIQSRGHLGSFLATVDYRKLWELSGNGTLMGLMPLPYSRRYEGLATGLYEAFETAGIPVNIGYMRGSSKRLEAVLEGHADFAVTSALAADEALRSKEQEWLAPVWLGPESYVSIHAILTLNPAFTGIQNGMRIGVDRASLDQFWLTEAECEGKDVEFVEVPYMNVVEELHQGKIDAAIWNSDEAVERYPGVHIVPLANEQARSLAEANTEAVVLIRRDREDLRHLLKRFLLVDQVRRVQEEVMSKKRMPTY